MKALREDYVLTIEPVIMFRLNVLFGFHGEFLPVVEIEGKGYVPRSQTRFLRDYGQASSSVHIFFRNVRKNENTCSCFFKIQMLIK